MEISISSFVHADPADVRRRVFLRKAFWGATGAFILAIALTCHPQNVESGLGAIFIVIAALVPTWCWIRGKIKGLPLFPVYAATYVPTFALPLLYEHPIVATFLPIDQFIAALTVTGFLVIATMVWRHIGRQPARPASKCLTLNAHAAELFFLCALGGGVILAVVTSGGWVKMPPGLYAIVRAVVLALEALACFVLSFRSGNGELRGERHALFKVLFCLLLASTLPGLLLVNAMSLAAVAALGFTLGARRFPIKSALVAIAIFMFLHAGKATMRELYWQQEDEPNLQPTSYPAFLSEWAATSSRNIFGSEAEAETVASQSLLERSSLIHLLLYVQTMTPGVTPYMLGETYAIIPSLFIPRFLNPEKGASHEGTYLLNIHYGFQSRDDTSRTTIGFGLLTEAYANFGFVGVGLLAAILGGYYAAVARWARMSPVLSFRSLFAVIVASYSFQTEFSAGVYVSALFQSLAALIIVAVLFMRIGDCSGAEHSIVE